MRTQSSWLKQLVAVAVVAGLALVQPVGAANRFVSNDGTWKMRDEYGDELPGTCYTSLPAALYNSSDTVIYVKNDYDCSADAPMSMDGTLNGRYLLSYNSVTIRSESGDWRTGATLTGKWDPEGSHGRGTNAFRVFSKSAVNNTGIQIIGFKLLDGATPTTDKESGNATPGCGGCVCGKGANDRVTLRNCLIAGGSAGEGGGAFMCRIENCVVTNNYAAKGGGLSACAPIMDTQLTHNTTHESGGGAAGGHLSAAAAVLTNCVIACNVMGVGGGMHGGAIDSVTAVRCIITNGGFFILIQ